MVGVQEENCEAARPPYAIHMQLRKEALFSIEEEGKDLHCCQRRIVRSEILAGLRRVWR